MKRIALFTLMALALLSACKKDDGAINNEESNNGIPKQGFELLTTNADSNYIILAKATDTTIIRSSQGYDFFEWPAEPITYNGNRSIRYTTQIDHIHTTSFTNIAITFSRQLTATETVPCNDVEQVIKPGKYNTGEQRGEVFIAAEDENNFTRYTELSSNNLPIEIVSVTKIDRAGGCAKYRVRGRIGAFKMDAYGCPFPWEVFTGGAFQLDYYVKQ